LRIEYERIEVERILWQPETGSFMSGGSAKFRRAAEGWRVEETVVPVTPETGPVLAS
jgi:hypothetical protein